MNKIPIFEAERIDSRRKVEGFYFAFPETTYCFVEDYERNPVKIIHCIVTHRMTDWVLGNEPACYRIDPDTLKQIGWFNADRTVYGTEKWFEEEEVD